MPASLKSLPVFHPGALPVSAVVSTDGIANLYSDHHRWLFAWLQRKLGCAHSAADLAQDTYERILVSGRLPQPGQSRAYLTQVAKGLMVDLYRRRHLEQSYLEALAALPEVTVPSPEERALVLETLVQIDAMLDGLPQKVRRAFLLSQLDGLGYAEIAREMGVSVSSVQKYMLRALQACYQALYD